MVVVVAVVMAVAVMAVAVAVAAAAVVVVVVVVVVVSFYFQQNTTIKQQQKFMITINKWIKALLHTREAIRLIKLPTKVYNNSL